MRNVIKGFVGVAMVGCVLATSVQAAFPLQLDIDVRTKRDTRSVGAGSGGEAKVQQISLTVKIRKSVGQAYTKPLTAELYVIGQQIQTGYYGIIGVVKKQFTLSKENDNTFEFSSPGYMVGKTTGNINVGGKYETYLVVVSDEDGNIIETRSGRNISEKGIEFIRKLGPKTLFDRDGNVVGSADGSAFRKAIPAAVSVSDDAD